MPHLMVEVQIGEAFALMLESSVLGQVAGSLGQLVSGSGQDVSFLV